MQMPNQADCLRYWDLSSQIRLEDAVALWCNVDPAELGRLGFDTQCMSAKRAALTTALREGRLEYAQDQLGRFRFAIAATAKDRSQGSRWATSDVPA